MRWVFFTVVLHSALYLVGCGSDQPGGDSDVARDGSIHAEMDGIGSDLVVDISADETSHLTDTPITETEETRDDLDVCNDGEMDVSSEQPDQEIDSVSDPCSRGGELELVSHITDLDLIRVIVPSGSIGAGNEIVGRTYFHVRDDIRAADERVPVRLPADAQLVAISYYQMSDDPDYPADYAMTFRLTDDVTFGFAHVKEVVDRISAVAPAEPSTTTSAQQYLEEPLAFVAGELIGHFYRSPTAFDFFFENRACPNTYVNQARYEADYNGNALYQVCPYQFFIDELRTEYYALFGGTNEPVEGVVECRGTSRDVEGTLSGTWFLDPDWSNGTARDNDGDHRWRLDIAIELDGEIKIGDLGGRLLRIHDDNSSHVDPETVVSDHCYQLWQTPSEQVPMGYALFNNIGDTTMEVAYGADGLCPESFPSEGFATYYR